jgi:hypothetical protein
MQLVKWSVQPIPQDSLHWQTKIPELIAIFLAVQCLCTRTGKRNTNILQEIWCISKSASLILTRRLSIYSCFQIHILSLRSLTEPKKNLKSLLWSFENQYNMLLMMNKENWQTTVSSNSTSVGSKDHKRTTEPDIFWRWCPGKRCHCCNDVKCTK